MKLKTLIKKLSALEKKMGNLEVRIDFDENEGWYDIEKVQIGNDDVDNIFINIASSNEL